MKLYKKIVIAVPAVLLLLIAVLVGLISSSGFLTKSLNRYVPSALNAGFHTVRADFTFFGTFPNISLCLDSVDVVSGAGNSAHESCFDTLLRADRLYIKLSLPALLAGNVNVREMCADNLKVNLLAAKSGNNWDCIAGQDTLSSKLPDSTDTALALDYDFLKIHDIRFVNGAELRFKSLDDTTDLLLKLDTLGVTPVRGGDSVGLLKHCLEHPYSLAVKGDVKYRMGEMDIPPVPVSVAGVLDFSMKNRLRCGFDRLVARAGDFPLELNGSVEMVGDSIVMSPLKVSVDDYEVSHLLDRLKDGVYPNAAFIKTDIKLTSSVVVEGGYKLAGGSIPKLTATVNIPQSSFKDSRYRGEVEQLVVNVKGGYDPLNKDSVYLDIKDFVLNGKGIKVRCRGYLNDLLRKAKIVAEVAGRVNLSALNDLYPSASGSYGKGDITADLKVKATAKEYSIEELINSQIVGKIVLKGIDVNLKRQGLYARIGNGEVNFGAQANVRDTSIEKGTRMFGVRAGADTASFRYGEELSVYLKDFVFAGHTATSILSGDTTRIAPLNLVISAKNALAICPDSVSLRLSGSRNHLSILPKDNDYSKARINVSSENERLFLRLPDGRFALRDCNLDFETYRIMGFEESARRRNARLDSLAEIFKDVPRDSLLLMARRNRTHTATVTRTDEFKDADVSFNLDRSLRRMLRNWSFRGSIFADGGRIRTPLFPLRNRINKIDFFFNDKELVLREFDVESGESDLNMRGSIKDIKSVLLGRKNIVAEIDLLSDTLNFNELVRAANEGARYAEKGDEEKARLRMLSDSSLDEQLTITGADSLEKVSPIVVPSNLDLKLTAEVKTGRYANLRIDLLLGEVYIKDRCVQLKDFMACTDAGEIDLTAFYAALNKQDISCGFDLDMKNVEAQRFIAVIPSMDSLLPMAKSFEGLLNCSMAATTQLDSAMNVKFETLKGIARLKGRNLVLLDGETFAEISKKLMFKNKKRNFIDSVSVELLVNENKIELFPFIMSMDRYRTAISGEQNLDMSFKYHISVLKSPIPFRLGVNIYGTPDDYHFRIGRAKYKNTNLPVYTHLIDTTRRNLSIYIANMYKRGINEILDAVKGENEAVKNLQLATEEGGGKDDNGNERVNTEAVEELSEEEKRLLAEYEKSRAAGSGSAEALNKAESGIAVVSSGQKIKLPEIERPANKKLKEK